MVMNKIKKHITNLQHQDIELCLPRWSEEIMSGNDSQARIMEQYAIAHNLFPASNKNEFFAAAEVTFGKKIDLNHWISVTADASPFVFGEKRKYCDMRNVNIEGSGYRIDNDQPYFHYAGDPETADVLRRVDKVGRIHLVVLAGTGFGCVFTRMNNIGAAIPVAILPETYACFPLVQEGTAELHTYFQTRIWLYSPDTVVRVSYNGVNNS